MKTLIEKMKSWGKNQNSHAIRSALMFMPVLTITGAIIIGITISTLQLLGLMPKPNTLTLQTLIGVILLFGAIITTMFVAAYIWANWLGHQGLRFIGLDSDFGKLLAGMLWGIGLQLFIFVILVASGWLQINNINVEGQAIINVLIVTASSLNTAVIEEVSFRGVLYSAFRRRWGWWMTALVTAALFAFPHFISNSYDFPISAGLALLTGGLLFAWAREITGTLWMPIGIHFAWDAAIGWFNLTASKTPHLLMTEFNAPKLITAEWGVGDWILLFVFAASLWAFKFRQRPRANPGQRA